MARKQKLPNYKGLKALYVYVGGLTVAQSVCILFQAYLLADIVASLFDGATVGSVTKRMGLFILVFMIRSGLVLIKQKLAFRFAENTGKDSRRRLLEALFRRGPKFARSEGTGKLVTLALEGVSQLRVFLEMYVPRMVSTAIIPTITLIYIFTKDRVSGLILLVTMPVLIIFMILLGLAARKKMDKQWESYRILSNHFVDTLRGLETLKFLGQSKNHKKTISRVSDQYRKATVSTLRIAFLSSFALDFFTMLSIASVAVGLGLRLVDGRMDLTTALIVLILAPEYFLPVREMGADFHATLNGQTAANDIEAIIDGAQGDGANAAVSASGEGGTTASTGALSAMPSAKVEGIAIELLDIGVHYAEDDVYALREVTFRAKGPLKVGIVGESGAGKSTLIDILAGFQQPTSGTVTVNGAEIGSLSQADWLLRTTFIPQNPYIFNRTLAENIRFYRPEATEAELRLAVQAAGLEGLATELPGGLEEQIGGGGRPLSGGQEQRVALARAFLSERPILLLDEPTAHLDIETESELKETMLKLFEQKLVFLATHRLHWMPDMDLVLVMDKGRVAEMGTHESLMRQQGVYSRLIASQMGGWR